MFYGAHATCDDAPEPVEDDYAARHGVDVVETPTRADFRDDVVEAVRAERAAGAFVVSRQRAMRVVLLDTPLLPPGYKGARAWHLFAVGCPPADENPLKLQHCFVRRRRPTYVFVVTRTSFVGIGFSAGRGVLLCSCLGGRCALVVRHVGFYQVFLRVPDGVQEHLLLRSCLHDADSGRSVGVAEGLPPVAGAAGHGPRSGGRARRRARRGQLRLERVLRCFATT